jgi:hypothetical protein
MVIGCENVDSRIVKVEKNRKPSNCQELGAIDVGAQRSFLMGDGKTVKIDNIPTV